MLKRNVRIATIFFAVILLAALAPGFLSCNLSGSTALASAKEGAPAGSKGLGTDVVWEQEAEDGTVTAPMVVADDPEASGGKYVYCPIEWSSGEVAFTFDLATRNDYYLWVLVKGQGWSQNSFFITMDTDSPIHYEIPQFSGEWTWGWDMVRPVDRAPKVWPLGAGTHTLRFRAREPYAGLDRLLLTDDPSYLPAGAAVPQYIWRQEAEAGVLTGTMTTGKILNASNCGYVYSATGYNDATATYSFDIVIPGNYYVWVRAMGQSYTNNSFFVSVDDGPEMHYEIPQVEEEWRWAWDIVHDADQEIQPVSLGTGEHTVQFRAREKNSWLDVVVITNDPVYVPGSVVPCITPIAPTGTVVPTSTPEPTLTLTPTATETATLEPTNTATPELTATATPTEAPTYTPSPKDMLWLPLMIFGQPG